MSKNVLVVEDDEILRLLTVEALSLLEVEISNCASADEALALLEGGHVYRLVISDITMPGKIDGLELAAIIMRRWPGLPVILSSGNRLALVEPLPLNIRYLPKPWDLQTLLDAVASALNNNP